MPKELNDISDRVLSHWFPTGKVPTHVREGSPGSLEGMGGPGLGE
jgi:hypothetical protein